MGLFYTVPSFIVYIAHNKEIFQAQNYTVRLCGVLINITSQQWFSNIDGDNFNLMSFARRACPRTRVDNVPPDSLQGYCLFTRLYEVHWLLENCRSRVGATEPVSSVLTFLPFTASSKNRLTVKCHVHLWQVSPQLSCCSTSNMNGTQWANANISLIGRAGF